jgi:hypothetical protein
VVVLQHPVVHVEPAQHALPGAPHVLVSDASAFGASLEGASDASSPASCGATPSGTL